MLLSVIASVIVVCPIMVRYIQKAVPSVDAAILMIYRTMSTTFVNYFNLFSLAISVPTIIYLPSIMRACVNSILLNLCQLLLSLWIPTINVYLCQVLCCYYRYPMCLSLTTVSCDSSVSRSHRLVLTCEYLCAKRNRGRGAAGYRGDISGNTLDTKKRQKY